MSDVARKAAREIEKKFYEKDVDRGYGQCPPRMLLSQDEIAETVDASGLSEVVEALRSIVSIGELATDPYKALSAIQSRAEAALKAGIAKAGS